MNEIARPSSPAHDSLRPTSAGAHDVGRPHGQAGLLDVLDRVLDKGVVIAGDISVNLLDIELLTIKIRLLIASVDKAKEMGIDWWQRDPQLSGVKGQHGHAAGNGQVARLEQENRALRERLERLEAKVGVSGERVPVASRRERAGG
jgi:hypothetical protein